jgi:hypothetical protein
MIKAMIIYCSLSVAFFFLQHPSFSKIFIKRAGLLLYGDSNACALTAIK